MKVITRQFMLLCAALLALIMVVSSAAHSQQADPTATNAAAATQSDLRVPDGSMNAYVLKAVENIYRDRKRGGYDITAAYSQDMQYGTSTVFALPKRTQAEPPPRRRTMCVAAAAEVMIEAINLYRADNLSGVDPYRLLPARTWTGKDLQSLMPYIFMHGDSRGVFTTNTSTTVPSGKDRQGRTILALARGTGHALEIFKIGEELPFTKLQPGDFVNFNRSKSGHAAIFLSYIDRNNKYTATYSPDIIGFKYFSAQGRGRVDAGFEYRDTYFDKAPTKTAGGHPSDVAIRSSRLLMLNGGRFWVPERWKVNEALMVIRELASTKVPPTVATREIEIENILNESNDTTIVNFSGEEG